MIGNIEYTLLGCLVIKKTSPIRNMYHVVNQSFKQLLPNFSKNVNWQRIPYRLCHHRQ